MEKETIKKELQLLNVHLPDKEKDFTQYPLPDGYFEQMQDNILHQMNQSSAKRIKPVRRVLRKWYAMAAAACLILAASWFIYQEKSDPSEMFSQLDDELIYSYLNENSDEIQYEVLVSLLDEMNLTTMDDVNPEEAENYIMDHLDELTIDELENI